MINLDSIDKKILTLLQKDATLSLSVISEKVGLSISACSRRIKHFEEQKLILQRTTLLDTQKIGRDTVVFIQISLEKQSEELLSSFENHIKNIPEILECFLMGGECDYLVKVRMKDVAAYEYFHRTKLTKLPGVTKISSLFGLRTVLQRNEIIL